MIANIAGGLASCLILIAFLALLGTTPSAARARAAVVRIRRDRQ
jgi:hypothetical protein